MRFCLQPGKKILWAVLILMCFGMSGPQQKEAPKETEEPKAAAEEVEKAAEPETQPASAPATQPASQPAAASQPAKPKTIPISFKDAKIDAISKFLTKHLGKPVIIVDDDIKKKKVTLVNPKPLPLDEAMNILTTALHEHGIAIEERERTIHLIPINDISKTQLKTIGPDVDIATVKPVNLIVRKIFVVKHYDPNKLKDILDPLKPEYGRILVDAPSKKVMVVASVERLITMSQLITELDQPDASGGELQVFPINNVEVYEIVPMLQQLIGAYMGVDVKAMEIGSTLDPRRRTASGLAPVTGAIRIGKGEQLVLLIPDPRRSAIVMVAPSNVLSQVGGWLKHLDQERPPNIQQEIVGIKYVDPMRLAGQLTDILNNIPDESLRSALRIFPFSSSQQLMIVGPEQNRNMVKEWIEKIDIPETRRDQRTFYLKYADAQDVAKNIKELYTRDRNTRVRYYYSYRDSNTGVDRQTVSVTANVRNNSVTVAAEPEKMDRITERIAEWDRPLEGDLIPPLIVTLKYADPETTKVLLENLFTKKEKAGQMPYWYYDNGAQDAELLGIGPLFGQFRFEAYPETGKLIVVSKNKENYEYIEKLIDRIDQPQTAGLPEVIQLKFADAETLAEQLNALLNAPGTPTSILRQRQVGDFSGFDEGGSPYAENASANRPNQPNQQDSNLSTMKFWWQLMPAEVKAKQPSNLIGKLRIVPNAERNSLLIAAPLEYAEAIRKFVAELDKPGMQVMIKAVIAEITHDDTTSLGFRFSTDPTLFTSGDPIITENALRGLLEYNFTDFFGQQNEITLDVDVNNLISMLRRVTDLKIKSEPRILTSDNVEGKFFDGQDIPFITNTQNTAEGTQNITFDYKEVGIKLQVRPHITKDKKVDLKVNLVISNVVPGRTLFGGAIVDRRQMDTTIVLENGRTFLISGILRREEREIIRRIPILGDIPLLGELFKHRELAEVNTEVLIFLTPYVIGGESDDPHGPIESEPQKRLKQLLPDVGVGELQGPPVESVEKDSDALPKPSDG